MKVQHEKKIQELEKSELMITTKLYDKSYFSLVPVSPNMQGGIQK